MTKLEAAREMVASIGNESLLLGFSGGKDSLAVLDVAVDVLGASRVECFFMRLVEGIECEMAPIKRAVRRYGVKLHVVPHWDLSRLYKRSILRPYVDGASSIRLLKQRDVEAHVRRATGHRWIAYGHRCVDNIVRNAMLKRDGMNGLDWKGERLYPVWDWKTPEVVAYLRARRVDLPVPLGAGALSSNGFALTPEFLAWLETHHPADYARTLAVFPLAGTQVARWRMFGRGGVDQSNKKRLQAAS